MLLMATRFNHCCFKDEGTCPTPSEVTTEFCRSCRTWRPNFGLVPKGTLRYKGRGETYIE